MRSLIRMSQVVALSVFVYVATTLLAPSAFAQTVIPLYPGDAPGSPQQANQEKQYFSKAWNTEVVTNVSRPTLTVYKPTGGVNSGSAVIICPGGGFMALSIENEGNQAATYLAARGITAFVLRYRLVPTEGDATEDFGRLLQNDRARFDQMVAKAVPIAIADGMAAVAYVRQHAAEYGVSPDRVGIMGFSAGGGVTTGVAFQYKPESRPAFLGFIYPGGQEFGDANSSGRCSAYVYRGSDGRHAQPPDGQHRPLPEVDRRQSSRRDPHVREGRSRLRHARPEYSYRPLD